MLLFSISLFVILSVLIIELIVGTKFLAFVLLIPIGFYLAYLFGRVRKFKLTFKPYIISLILAFIDDRITHGSLSYNEEGKIESSTFLRSGLFAPKGTSYYGEDYINGEIGDLKFEMCELWVKESSKVRSKLVDVFRGVFVCVTLPEEIVGSLRVWPKVFRQHLSRPIRHFVTRHQAEAINADTLIESFQSNYMVYKDPAADLRELLGMEMQRAILDYQLTNSKSLYLSFEKDQLFIAIPEEKDLLEPSLFRSNLKFSLIQTFYKDIETMIKIVLEFDRIRG